MGYAFNIFFVVVFLALLAATAVARLRLLPRDPEPQIEVVESLSRGDPANGKLFIYVPGLDRARGWPQCQSELRAHGDVVMLSYPDLRWSNAAPLAVAERLAAAIEKRFVADEHQEVVLIGHSLGALLAKRAFLAGEADGHKWSDNVSRVVLLAGMNRGWDISGQKPSDMGLMRWATIWIGSWAARVVGFGGLVLGTETGSPFVANLRVDWINRMRSSSQRPVEVVQLLGDIDDLVSAEDNKDLQAVANRPFAWVTVRGTGHSNIVDFDDDTPAGEVTLGEYRRQKFLLATTTPFEDVELQNEIEPFQPDRDVTHLVFVVHGIRDLGRWAAGFEQELRRQFRRDQGPGSKAKLAVASIRYGYFGMGPFLLRPVRQKYVKWFMDEYTEALARYPEAREVHFVGHSNGTYLLATALQQYEALDVKRVVFGGSVVRRDYDWPHRLATHPGLSVRNYTAIDDWVVALFPRFFEPAPVTILQNDIGSAGFGGFTRTARRVENVHGLTGGHSAFLGRVEEIADFILHGAPARPGPGRTDSWVGAVTSRLSRWGSAWGTWVIVWPALAVLLLFVGWHVVSAASEPRWPFALAYAILLLVILRNV